MTFGEWIFVVIIGVLMWHVAPVILSVLTVVFAAVAGAFVFAVVFVCGCIKGAVDRGMRK